MVRSGSWDAASRNASCRTRARLFVTGPRPLRGTTTGMIITAGCGMPETDIELVGSKSKASRGFKKILTFMETG